MIKSLLAVAVCFMFTSLALADPPDNRPPDNRPPQKQGQLGVNAQAQGQIQGQKQRQRSSQRIGNVGSSSGVSFGHDSMNSTSNSNANASNGDQANSQTINFNSPDKVNNHTSGEVDLNTTPDVMAPALTAGMNPCVLSSSAGGSITGFGISVGHSYADEGCELRNLAGMLHQMGHEDASRELLCQDARVAAAFATVGMPCKEATTGAQNAVYSVIPNGPRPPEDEASGDIIEAAYIVESR